jgi:type IV pilus assembly protein PilB
MGDLLVRAGLITTEQLERALAEQSHTGGKLGEVLVRQKLLTEEQIAESLAEQKGLEHVNLATYFIDRTAAALLPVRVARRRGIIPIGFREDYILLAMADPLDVEAADETQILTGYKVIPVVSSASQVAYAIEKYLVATDVLQELEASEGDEDLASDNVDVSEIEGDVPVVRIVNQLLREAVLDRASDIHFEPEETAVRVRYRIDGVLQDVARLPKASQPGLISRLKIMGELDITERRRTQDGRISLRMEDRPIDLRVAVLPTPYGECIVLRVLNTEVSFLEIGELGLSPHNREILERMLSKPYGAVLIAGPTGSGKSTTLYASLNELNVPSRKIITVEDPIEYRLAGITQVAANHRIGMTFAGGLRTILRADPDVVMVGEIRDPETASIAIRAALTGHLVLSSIHTNDAPSALTRLNEMGVESYVTSSALVGSVAQRLVRVLCPHCKGVVSFKSDELVSAGFTPAEAKRLKTYGPVGCDECNGTGYHGRQGVFEIMEVDDDIKHLYLHNAPADEMRAAAIEKGMHTLRQDALEKVAAGITSLDEVARVVV